MLFNFFRSYRDKTISNYANDQYFENNFEKINRGHELVKVIQKSEMNHNSITFLIKFFVFLF